MKTGRDHEWIEVGQRRWCMTCDSFQMKTNPSGDWKGWAGMFCPRSTQYALKCDNGEYDIPQASKRKAGDNG